jgi:hypothetical protein
MHESGRARSESARIGAWRTALACLLGATVPVEAHGAGRKPDLSGICVQDRGSWVIDQLPFTPAGAAKHASKKTPNAVQACTVHY